MHVNLGTREIKKKCIFVLSLFSASAFEIATFEFNPSKVFFLFDNNNMKYKPG